MTRKSRFAIHDMRSVTAAARRRLPQDWDFRFVTAVLLLYGCIGVAFFAVEWLDAAPDTTPPSLQELRNWQSGRTGPHPVLRSHVPEPTVSAPAEGQ